MSAEPSRSRTPRPEPPSRLLRMVRTNPPTFRDFLSFEARNQPRPPGISEREWAGVSMFGDWNSLLAMLRRVRHLRTGLCAVVEIVPGAGVEVQQTFQPGHYTVWADPDTLLRSVVEVIEDERLR